MTTTRRGILAIVSFATLGVLAWVLFSNKSQTSPNPVEVRISELQPGQYFEFKWDRRPVIVYRRTEEDLKALMLLTNEVFPSTKDSVHISPTYRSKDPNYFVAIFVSPYSECTLKFVPKNDQRFVRTGKKWLGGFLDICREIPYDLAGRPIKPGIYSPNNYSEPTAALDIPPYTIIPGERVLIGKSSE